MDRSSRVCPRRFTHSSCDQLRLCSFVVNVSIEGRLVRVLRITQVCVRIVPITSMEDEHDSVRKIDGSELYVIVGEIRQSESQYRNEFWIDQ